MLKQHVQVLNFTLSRPQLQQLFVQLPLELVRVLSLCGQVPTQLFVVVLQHQELPVTCLAQPLQLSLLREQLRTGLGQLGLELPQGELLLSVAGFHIAALAL